MQTTSERSREFVERLANQSRYPDAFVRCPACSGNRACAYCLGTRKVSRATRREMVEARAA